MGIHANLNIFDYDNAGNLLKDDKASYSYDGFNRTIKVETFDGNVQINRYDAEGLRYEMEENNHLVKFIFNQNREVIAEQETIWTSYIRGSTLLASSADHARTYYHYASDEMSSITHIVDDEKVLNEYEYDAWGEVVSEKETVKNRFKFNGQQLDPITQQYYLRARFYNPVIARFTQEDTYRGDGLNLYAYCGNNPVYYVDPTGNARNCVKEAYDEIRAANHGMSAIEAHRLAMEQAGVKPVNQNNTPIPDVPNDRSMTREQWDTVYSQARASQNNSSSLTYLGNNAWQSNSGLIYGNDNTHGNKVQHILAHTSPNPNKTKPHTVFSVDSSEIIGIVDEAWSRGMVDPKDKAAYVADMGRVIGINGETHIRVIVLPGNRILSAYPV